MRNIIKHGLQKRGVMDSRIILLLALILLALLPNCRKRTRQQKKIDKATKERIISNF